MPADRDKVKELSIRIPNDLWADILEIFKNRHQDSIPHNQKILTLLREAMDRYQIADEKESPKKTG
ncbi:hypothetical protein GF348_09335 [candidate division KSB3 bacterium]|nr:hypothetical protein [candidate division KSB3 bacterium]